MHSTSSDHPFPLSGEGAIPLSAASTYLRPLDLTLSAHGGTARLEHALLQGLVHLLRSWPPIHSEGISLRRVVDLFASSGTAIGVP